MKHRSVYQYHLKYIRNDIVKPFRVRILCYADRVREMHDLAKYLPPPSMNGKSYEAANWKFCYQLFTVIEIHVAIQGGIPSSIQYDLDDYLEDHHSLAHEYWCGLLSTIQVKDVRKRASIQIKKIDSARASSLSDSDISVRIPMKKKARLGAGFLCSNKGPHKKLRNNCGTQRYCVLCKKAGMPEKSICRIVPRTLTHAHQPYLQGGTGRIYGK